MLPCHADGPIAVTANVGGSKMPSRRGTPPGIAAHPHSQLRVTAALSGGVRSRSSIGFSRFLRPVPLYPGMPHKGLPVGHEEARCLNFYLDLDGFAQWLHLTQET